MIITVFNTCGVGGKENAAEYVGAIHALLNQRGVTQRVVLSSCRNKPEDWDRLMQEFGNRISYCLTEELLPINITFNHACQRAAEAYGRPAAFLYVDSGCTPEWDHTAVARLHAAHAEGGFAMTAALVSEDDGLPWWFAGQNHDQIFNRTNRLVMPVGKTCNLHFQLFDPVIADTFGHLLPDIFASYCTESTFTFVCEAVGKKFLLCRDVTVRHSMSLDGASAGFRDGMGWRHLLPFAPRTMDEVVNDPEGYKAGFGFEECQRVMLHDQNVYRGGAVGDPRRLADFIRKNIYLPRDKFDYDNIQHVFIP